MLNKNVYILLLNWNGWPDTIECLESIFRVSYNNYRVIVCDNGSNDNSILNIQLWAENRLDLYIPKQQPLRNYSSPPVIKVIPYVEYDRTVAENGGSIDDINAKLILIRTGGNLGFAGGNNVGIRYVLRRSDFEYLWILNNDTVVSESSLLELIRHAEQNRTHRKVGLIGSKLMFYHSPRVIQSIGGQYNKWTAAVKHLGANELDHGQYDTGTGFQKADYPIGASLFVSLEFIRDVGLMNEEYFLYYEELDWVLRGKKKGWEMGLCPNSKIYHKEGATIGSNSNAVNKSALSDYYGLRNRIIFTRNYYPMHLFFVRLTFLVVIVNRIYRKQFNRIGLVINAFFDKSDTSTL